MNYSKSKEFEHIYRGLKLSHHPFSRMLKYLSWCFRDVDFHNKSVLDIGGGNGIYSYYSRYKGSSSALNLEPFASGSTKFDLDEGEAIGQLSISVRNETIQDFNSTKKFDVIILHDSINHLDEAMFEKIHTDKSKFSDYKKLVNKIIGLLSDDGVIVITDCSSKNFWGDVGLKSPFAPTIDWYLHQRPQLVEKLFENHAFKSKLRWSPFKRFGYFGRLLSLLGYIPSYFMQSHFNLILRKK